MVLNLPTPGGDQQPKRTRVVVKQSKNGCFTCKARRVKCDEGKPSCQRCSRSNKICEGYPRPRSPCRSSSDLTPSSSSSEGISSHLEQIKPLAGPRYAMFDGFQRNSEQDRLSKLACQVLAHDPLQDESSYSKCVWEYLLPQLSHAIPTVNAAAAAFGAFYELRLIPNKHPSQSLANKRYDRALLAVQQDLLKQPHGPVPLLLACVMLASVELMQRRQLNALIHLQGAFKILLASGRSSAGALDGAGPVLTPTSSNTDVGPSSDDDVTLLFRALDMQTAGYVLGRPPYLPTGVFDNTGNRFRKFECVSEAEARLIQLLHSCYHFTGRASAFKYLPRHPSVPSLLLEQGRHVAQLSQWLEMLDRSVLRVQPGHIQQLSLKSYCHALALRAQCLGTLVYASNVLSAYEVSYDDHASRFTQITEDAATVMSSSQDVMVNLHQFRPGPGMVQALFLTAIKYRHSTCRRRAIELLQRTGLEGPWDGKLLAAVASKAVEIEERNVDGEALQEKDRLPEHISELDRLHGCGMDSDAAPNKPANRVSVTFSRCRDMEHMLSGANQWDQETNWEIWDEELSF